MRVHANDGIAADAVATLEKEGFKVTTQHVPQDGLQRYLVDEAVDILLVRSATTVREDLIDACPGLKVIGRGGVGMDNIDVAHARGKGIEVVNTPAASSISVAELVFGHLLALSRGLHQANRAMPTADAEAFKKLKKAYATGSELRGSTLGIIGFGRIGQWVARYGIGLGMNVIVHDPRSEMDRIDVTLGDQVVHIPVKHVGLKELLEQADAVSLHVPAQSDGVAVVGAKELSWMKSTAVLVNSARGGSVDEDALLAALEAGKLKGAALDVFVGEPQPRADLLANEKISLSPHIGAATTEAQDRIGSELASVIIAWSKSAVARS